MRAARDWQDPPLGRWGIKRRHHPRALLFKEAMRAFEDSLCTCGHSAFVAFDRHDLTLQTSEFHPVEVVCAACEVREAVAQARKPDEVSLGQKTFVRHNPKAVTDA